MKTTRTWLAKCMTERKGGISDLSALPSDRWNPDSNAWRHGLGTEFSDSRICPNRLISIVRMKPDEYNNRGKNLFVDYDVVPVFEGKVFVASTEKGVCCMGFVDSHATAADILYKKFPHANIAQKYGKWQQMVHSFWLSVCNGGGETVYDKEPISLHLKGTEFQFRVWQALLAVPLGGLLAYKDIAKIVGTPGACRAVGTAIGQNPVAVLIPCHRIVRTSGEIGGYRWGLSCKTRLLNWEASVK